jgi:NADH-quinone oxidoreductase subunit J
MQLALFIIFAALALLGALNLLLQKHPINSALSLVVVMMSLAVLYWSLGAEFLAAAQVIVYSGAIMVLFVFVIMLLNAGEEEHTTGSRAAYFAGIPGATAVFCLLSFVFLSESKAIGNVHLGPALTGVVSPISAYLILAAILFSIGIAAFLIKRNVISVFMSIELMLNAVNLTFVAFAHRWHAVSGQIFVFFVMVVAAAEAAVGLAIIIGIFRTRKTLNVDQINLMNN